MPIKPILAAIIIVYMAYWLYSNLIVRTKEGYRSVVLRFGKLHAILGPGVVAKLPVIDKVIRLDLTTAVPNWWGLSEAELKKKISEKINEMLSQSEDHGIES